ncbi:MAG: 3-oxoacyl-ACP reductase [Acidobacteriota bacterium]|jgi:NAD(P)-dependent dehydrogenase (short-subunit alcohol dehydrogenase family)
MKRFESRVAIVTGGGGEIGRATACRLAAEGAIVAVSDIDLKSATSVAGEIRQAGGAAMAIGTNVASRPEVEALAAEVRSRYGHIDILCNIAGIAPPAPFLETSDQRWDETIDINLKGVFLCSQVVARVMVADGRPGTIVNMASTNGLVGEVDLVAYNASKFGVVGITMTAAIELARHRIRVNAVAPGMIRTRLSQAVLEQNPELTRSYLNDKIPLARFGEPDEVAAAVAFLASDDSGFITGHTLVIDGGQLTF